MKKIKKYIIISICIIVILIIAIIVADILVQKGNNSNSQADYNNIEEIQETNISEVKDINEYATIERLVNVYNLAINQLDANLDAMMVQHQDEEAREKIKGKYNEQGKEILKNILEAKYLSDSDWENQLLKYSNNKFYINKMKKTSINNINVYLINMIYGEAKNTDIIILNDIANNTFSVLPKEYLNNKSIDENNLIESIKELNVSQISKNDNNGITQFNLTEEQACLKYYYNYLNMLRNDTDKLYSTIDRDYKEKRFENVEKFNEYINNNRERLEKATLSKYEVRNNDDYIQYICVDEEGNYYIFNATSAMQYTLILDTYTIDLPQFTEKYNNANAQEKVALNINKFIAALNAQDYRYIYSKLADSFKNNYFENEESLKEYLVNNLYENNEVEFEDFAQEGTIYTYKIKVTKIISKEEEERYYGKNAPTQNVNIVMQLNEGTDFIMSFSIEE